MTSSLLSEAERMDRHYRFQRYVYDATRTYYLVGRQHLIRELKPLPGQHVLEIGCGTAWNLVRVARAYSGVNCCGIDVSEAMLETARSSVSRNGLGDRIMLRQSDATCADPSRLFGEDQYERVFFSYALSMIPRWKDALDHAAAFIAPGGSLHIVDFGQCEHMPGLFKRALFAFLRCYAVTPHAELQPVIQSCGLKHGLQVEFRQLHRGYTDYAVLTRK